MANAVTKEDAEIKKFLQDFRKEQDKRLATQSSAGLMSAADKKKLDNFQADSIFSSKKILSFAAIREYSS